MSAAVAPTPVPRTQVDAEGVRRMTVVWMVTGAILLLVLALAGLLMRWSQAIPGLISPRVFYALLTFHGIAWWGSH